MAKYGAEFLELVFASEEPRRIRSSAFPPLCIWICSACSDQSLLPSICLRVSPPLPSRGHAPARPDDGGPAPSLKRGDAHSDSSGRTPIWRLPQPLPESPSHLPARTPVRGWACSSPAPDASGFNERSRPTRQRLLLHGNSSRTRRSIPVLLRGSDHPLIALAVGEEHVERLTRSSRSK